MKAKVGKRKRKYYSVKKKKTGAYKVLTSNPVSVCHSFFICTKLGLDMAPWYDREKSKEQDEGN